MSGLHREKALEDEICDHLRAHGWYYVEGDAKRWDRERALYPDDVAHWIEHQQPEVWKKIGGAAGMPALLDRLRSALNTLGVLEVLRGGFEHVGVKGKIKVCQFKPALEMNEELVRRYEANRLRVVRQVRYSMFGEQSLDLVLCVNGVPVATAELKSDFTQSVQDAIAQYRQDRQPIAPGLNKAEPLLSTPGGALVHFAVSNSEVYMTTQLKGLETVFLPFNRGDHGGAGNPEDPRGHKTAYLWEEVWAFDSWLEILGRYVVPKRDKKRKIERWIFPRYHQLDATRRLVEAIRVEGVGGRYLIQHSAGSGKTNSIAWTANFLAELHDDAQRKVFDTVLVVSDRTVLDRQLREALEAFERTRGVLAVVSGAGASKSEELSDALSQGKKIVVCTIQTFPFALEYVQQQAATQGKRFAVIADEAHSSQTGEAAAKLKAVLSAEALATLADGGEWDTEDMLAAQMAAKASQDGLTYVAFTATPKAKTLQMFGRTPDPSRPAGADNLPAPFHVYSMRQAIEEGFILDVLQHYTSYDVAFQIAHRGRPEEVEEEVDASEAVKGIMGWVRLHPHNIRQKVQVVIEHFRQNVAHRLGGRAKAMVVTASRKEAVRWTLEMRRYIERRGYGLGLLVAFSGEVEDPESGASAFSEATMNPGLKGRDIRDALEEPEYSILLVANKYQTGFDQPLLCAMYVDRPLGGVQAVQTLSRLNRAYEGKDAVLVVDFVNKPEAILAAFKPYYDTAKLSGITDPVVVLELKEKLDAQGFYDEFEVRRVVEAALRRNATQAELHRAISPVASRLLTRYKEAQERMRREDLAPEERAESKQELEALRLFKHDAALFTRYYAYMSQIVDYGATAVEARAIFFRLLVPLLGFGRERAGIDPSALQLTHYTLKELGTQRINLRSGEESAQLSPEEPGGGAVQDRAKARLEELIARINGLFEGELSELDKITYVRDVVKGKLLENETLRRQALDNSAAQFARSDDLNSALLEVIISALSSHQQMGKQMLNSPERREALREVLLEDDLHGALRRVAGEPSPLPPTKMLPRAIAQRFWESQGARIGEFAEVWALGVYDAQGMRDARGVPVESLSGLGESWMFFVDPTPEANWAHVCSWVAIDVVRQRVTEAEWTWPPSDDVPMDRLERPAGDKR